jgi:hypothetical protein
MGKKKFETQFSIYKVDYNQSIKFFKEGVKKDIDSYDTLEKEIINYILETIEKKNNSETKIIEDDDFKGIVFKTFHYPSWKSIINSFIDESFEIYNAHVSYILTYKKNDNIFILTGGLGSNYINDFTQKNYGLHLLPKIIKEDSPVIKTVLENNLSGNKLSTKHSNRNVTTVNTENDMSSIFRELSLEFKNDLINELGIYTSEETNKRIINILAKDSFVIRKSITIEDLKQVLNKLLEIEQKEDSFSLGYFVDVKKNGYSTKEISAMMINYFLEKKIDNFVLVGNEHLEYYLGGNHYVITDQNDKIVYESTNPIDFKELFNYCFSDDISKAAIERFLKYNISVYNDNDIILYPIRIKSCLQGYVEDENKTPFFLFNDNWFMFESKYEDNLDKEFKKNYSNLEQFNPILSKILKNSDSTMSEDTYNKKYADSSDIIVAHTVLSNNIELADLIYYDEDDNLYLIHNKEIFNGNGARDVMNQVLTSAGFINHYALEEKRKEIYEEYYNKIVNKYPNNEKIKHISSEKFVDLFCNATNIFYVVGFVEKFSEDIKSNYAKYMTIDTNKKLLERGYKLLLFNIN